MDPDILRKIDEVLDRIKDMQTGMTLSQLGIVEKIRHLEKEKKLIVFLKTMGNSKACCAALNMVVFADNEKNLQRELEKEFPQFSISFTEG